MGLSNAVPRSWVGDFEIFKQRRGRGRPNKMNYGRWAVEPQLCTQCWEWGFFGDDDRMICLVEPCPCSSAQWTT